MNLNRRLPALPYVLLGAMTLVSFGGPVAMLVVVRGGSSADWPPDRAIEWLTIGAIFGLFITIFIACVSISLWYRVRGSVSAGADATRADRGLPESGETPNTIH
jgi:hypothetical protein